MNFGLLGHPLGHSMSPFIHQQLFLANGIEATYNLFDVSLQNLPNEMQNLLRLNGFNVTIPYKKEIVKYLDCLDNSASKYNSVNVVKTGYKNIGFNTDVVGFTKSVKGMGASLNSDVLLLGCGGVSQMMGAEVLLAGGNLTVAVRDKVKAQNFVDFLQTKKPNSKIKLLDINKIEGNFDLLINGTSVGMHPNMDVSPVSKEVVSNCKFVFDAIYNPKDTLLAKYAQACNKVCVTGMEMLVRQAAEAQTIWLGVSFDQKTIADIIAKANIYMQNK